jgi:hypothetical protein
MKRSFSVLVMLLLFAAHSWAGERFNFNAGWKVQMGKNPKAGKSTTLSIIEVEFNEEK